MLHQTPYYIYGHHHPQEYETPPHERMVVAVVDPACRGSPLQPASHRAGLVLRSSSSFWPSEQLFCTHTSGRATPRMSLNPHNTSM